jgi:AAA family ATP:ADP antiporter
MLEFIRQLCKDQKKFMLMCLGFSFLITLDYGCLRPAAQGLFITHFGSKYLPWVWLASLPINFFIVAFINKLQSRFGSKAVSFSCPWIVIVINGVLSLVMGSHKGAALVLYMWKDLYILLMFQQIWSQIHASMSQNVGRYFYGAMYAVGALGSLVGSSIPALLKFPPSSYLLCTLWIYPLVAFIQIRLAQNSLHAPLEKKPSSQSMDGVKQVLAHSELITIALLVAFMQMVAALSEFNFSFHLEHQFQDLVSRTQKSASMMSGLQAITLSLQLLLTFFSIEKLGVKKGHLFIPLIISFSSGCYLLFPSFQTASINYMSCKSLDFSLFSVLKERLYAPLDKAFKYEAKAFIDIFIYRGAKTLMSLGLIIFGSLHSSLFFGILLFALAITWFMVAHFRLKNFSVS